MPHSVTSGSTNVPFCSHGKRNTIAALLSLLLLPLSGYTAEPPDCSGYPEPRVFLESQAWWWLSDKTELLQTGDDFGHIHVGTCFPQGETIGGDVEFDVRLVMHDNPGFIHHLVIQIWRDGKDNCLAGGIACVDLTDAPLTCPPEETCTFWLNNVIVPTTDVPTNGRKEFRFRPFVEQPDGNRMFASTGWQAYIDNGDLPVSHFRSSDMVEGRGWYEGANYQISRLEALPDEPVAGTWAPAVHMKPASGGGPTTYHIAMVDPNFHSDPPSEGVVVKEAAGEFIGDLSIDTTKLSDGWHRLALRADSDTVNNQECVRADGSLCDSTVSGLLITWFEVDNTPRPSPPTNVMVN